MIGRCGDSGDAGVRCEEGQCVVSPHTSHTSPSVVRDVIQQEEVTSNQAQSGGESGHREHDSGSQLFRTNTNTDHGTARGQLPGDDDADQGPDVS